MELESLDVRLLARDEVSVLNRIFTILTVTLFGSVFGLESTYYEWLLVSPSISETDRGHSVCC